MIVIQYSSTPRIKRTAQRVEIFCVIRKKWLLMTPEEWVRQNFLLHLIVSLGFSPSLIAVEKQIMLGSIKKRFDIVVYQKEMVPYMLIECKEMEVVLTEDVLLQAMRYNLPMQAPYILLTNGTHCMVFQVNEGKLALLPSIPSSF